MAATRDDISGWFDKGVEDKKGFMIVVCDTYDYEDYPVYVDEGTFDDEYKSHDGPNMTRIMEVYNLNMDKTAQMDQARVFNYPKGWSKNA